MKQKETTEAQQKKGKLRLVWRFLEGSKRYFVLTMLFTVAVSLLELINPKIIGFTIDSVIGDKQHTYGGIIAKIIDYFGGTAGLK